MKSPFEGDSQSVTFSGAGSAGAHSDVTVLLPGCYVITAGGTAGGATLTAKLRDTAGNLFDIPNYNSSGAAAIPGSYPVTFHSAGHTLVLSTTGAGVSTALTITIGRME